MINYCNLSTMKSYHKVIEKTLIVVPAFNAAKSIEKVLDEILITGFNNIIVGEIFSYKLDSIISFSRK